MYINNIYIDIIMDKIVSNDYSHLKANFEIQVLLLHSFKKISYFHKFSINLLSSIDSYRTANELNIYITQSQRACIIKQ